MNEDARSDFVLRASIVTSIRRYLDTEGLRGGRDADPAAALRGAAAQPFVTHSNELDADLYLRIATELYLKRLDRGRTRAGLRDRQGLPQRGDLVQAQPRVHDARVVRGLRRLPRHDGAHRGAGRAGRARGDRDDTRSRSAATRSTSKRPWPRVRFVDALDEHDLWARDADELRAATRRARRRHVAGQDLGAARRQGVHAATSSRSSCSRRSCTTIRSSCPRSRARPTTTRRSPSGSSSTPAGWSSAMRSAS